MCGGYFKSGIIPAFWYFPSLICGVGFVFLLTNFLPDKYSAIIVIIMYGIGLFGDGYANVQLLGNIYSMYWKPIHLQFFSYTSRNGLLFGTLFIWLGRMLKKYENEIRIILRKISLYWLVLTIFIMTALLSLEFHLYVTYQLGVDANVLISIVPLTILIFILGLCINPVKRKRGMIIRQCSTIMYTIHPFLISRFGNITTSSIANYFIVLILSVIVALALVLSRKYVKILKYIM